MTVNNTKNKEYVKAWIILAVIIPFVVVLFYLAWSNHDEFEMAIVSQTQQELLITAKTAATSIEEFIDEHLDALKNLSLNPEIQKNSSEKIMWRQSNSGFCHLTALYEIHKGVMDALYLLDANGIILDRKPFKENRIGRDCSGKPGVAYILKEQKPYISEILLNNAGKPCIAVSEPIFYEGEFAGITRWMIEIETISERFIEPIEVGKKGYCWLIDAQTTMLSHPNPDHISKPIMALRKEKFPGHDWSELEAIVEKMTEGEEGVGIYHSAWWTEKDLKIARKIIAYAPVNVGSGLWSIGVSMSYSEITGPINSHARNIFMLVGLMLLAMAASGLSYYRIYKKKAQLEAETKYLGEIVRSTEALKDSERKLLEAQRAAHIGNWDWNLATNDLYWSAENYRIFGLDPEKVKPSFEAFMEAVEPEDVELVTESVEMAMKGEKPYDIDIHINRRDGMKRVVNARGEVEFDESGRAVRMYGTVQDITDRKKAEKAMCESKERYRNLYEAVQAGVILQAADGTIIHANQVACDIFEMTADGITSKTSLDPAWKMIMEDGTPVSGEDHPSMITIRTGKAIRGAVRGLFGGNRSKTMWLLINTKPIIDSASSKLKEVLITFVDITEHKRAEEALEKSEKGYRELFNSVMEGIGLVDKDEIIKFCNPAYAKIFEADSVEDLIGKCLLDYVPESQKKLVLSETKVRKEKKSTRYELEIITAKGNRKIILVSVSPKFDDENNYIGALGAIMDVTETKRLQEFASRAQRLETAGRIAGQVAHDFNNLLGPLVAYPAVIKDEIPKDHPIIPYLRDMEMAADQMAEINQQLLTLGRRGHYAQETLNLNDVINQAFHQLEPKPSTLFIDTDLSRDLMNIKGGAAQILRIISNLVTNSMDAMQNKGHLFIKTENYYVDDISVKYERVPKGEYVKVTITDTGCGIPEDALPKIFDPFFTTKTAGKRRGSGLGLSVVHAIMEDHHGHIDLQTKVGQGSSFYLYFPITREAVETTVTEEIKGGSESVLVVDDDKLQREVALSLLKKLGYNATAVESGEIAIEFLKGNPHDLLILDMIMPDGIDGTETYQKALEINPGQKAIIVSGFAETERVDSAMKLGVGAFVRKPLTLKSISAAVRKELDKVLV